MVAALPTLVAAPPTLVVALLTLVAALPTLATQVLLAPAAPPLPRTSIQVQSNILNHRAPVITIKLKITKVST